MPIEYLKRHNRYRNFVPRGHYDLVIVSLVHQPSDILFSMMRNIERFVKGNFLWVVHYNNEDPVDETTLPPWMWLVRHPIWTDRSSRTLAHAVTKCLSFALETVSFTNVLTFSSGSMFFREFEVPVRPQVCFLTHTRIFEEVKEPNHESPIPIETIRFTAECLKAMGIPPWQYGLGFDQDTGFHHCVRERKFTHVRGSQWSGQLWPHTVAVWLVEDLRLLETLPDAKYTCEEIYLATYASNYAERYHMQVGFCVVAIHWGQYYNIEDPLYVELMKEGYHYGYAICRINDSMDHPVRQLLS